MMTRLRCADALASPMKPIPSETQDRTPDPESAFDPVLLRETFQRQLARPLGVHATPGRIRTRQREIVDLLLGEDPMALPDRVALLDEVLLDFEAAHPEPLASLHPWKQNGLRSYLVARGELVKATWLLGDHEAALEEQAMLLELDPGNHFFQREQMLAFLLAMEDWESLRTELAQGSKGRKENLLRRLLSLAISLGEGKTTEAELKAKALRISHPRALDLWSGRKELPIEIPIEAEEGSREESILAASFLRPFTPQALYADLRKLATVSDENLETPKHLARKPGDKVSLASEEKLRTLLKQADLSAEDLEKRLHHLRRALRTAEGRIDPTTFAKTRGHFSDHPRTAQYLEILLRLGLTLFQAGRVEEARAHLGRMLDLDQADTFGARAYLDGMRNKKRQTPKTSPDEAEAGSA